MPQCNRNLNHYNVDGGLVTPAFMVLRSLLKYMEAWQSKGYNKESA